MKMSKFSNSPLLAYIRISPNKSSPRNREIDTITIHCVAGNLTIESLGALFAPTSRQASSNYGIGSDGRIGMYAEEKDRSWCTSSAANDHRAITIEVANTTAQHPWPVSEKAFAALIDLVTCICKRNNIKRLLWKADKKLIGMVNLQNMTVHRWFANKACPGDVLFGRHAEIAAEVNRRLDAPPQGVNVSIGGVTLRVPAQNTDGRWVITLPEGPEGQPQPNVLLRVVLDALGLSVSWDGESSMIITTPK